MKTSICDSLKDSVPRYRSVPRRDVSLLNFCDAFIRKRSIGLTSEGTEYEKEVFISNIELLNEKKENHDGDVMIVTFDEMISIVEKIPDSSK